MATTVMSNALTPGITSLANLANVTSAELTGRGHMSRWELLFTPAAGLTAGVTVSLWLLPTVDGTNYADGGSADPAAAHLAAVFVCASGAGQQRLASAPLQLPVGTFKAVISNDTGQAFSAATTHTLSYTKLSKAQANASFGA